MKRFAPVALVLIGLAAKKKAMLVGDRHGADQREHHRFQHGREHRRHRWEEQARAWHQREHEIHEA